MFLYSYSCFINSLNNFFYSLFPLHFWILMLCPSYKWNYLSFPSPIFIIFNGLSRNAYIMSVMALLYSPFPLSTLRNSSTFHTKGICSFFQEILTFRRAQYLEHQEHCELKTQAWKLISSLNNRIFLIFTITMAQ